MAFVAGLLGDFDRYLARGDIDLLRDGVSYRLAGLWLDDAGTRNCCVSSPGCSSPGWRPAAAGPEAARSSGPSCSPGARPALARGTGPHPTPTTGRISAGGRDRIPL